MAVTIQEKVLIIGGGPAGFALAQILRKQGVPFEIFERDDDVHARKQGWAVLLFECLPAFLAALPDDLGDIQQVSVNYNANDLDSMAIIGADDGDLVARIGGSPRGTPGYAIRANRQKLRSYLAQHIPVKQGKVFDHYVEDTGGVTAYFRDGTQARGTILVGIDGAHSHVRSQLLQHSPGPVLSRYINVLGECDLTPDMYQPIRDIGSAGVIGVKDGYRMLVGQRSMKADMSSAGYYWMVTWQTTDPESASQALTETSKQELLQKAIDMSDGVSDLLMNIVRNSNPEDVIFPPIKFTEFVSPDSIPTGRITLVGDALHTMVPFRAAGANTAILDACDFGAAIAKGLKAKAETNGNTLNWSSVFEDYHKIALPRGRETVLKSRAAGESDPAAMEPVWKVQ